VALEALVRGEQTEHERTSLPLKSTRSRGVPTPHRRSDWNEAVANLLTLAQGHSANFSSCHAATRRLYTVLSATDPTREGRVPYGKLQLELWRPRTAHKNEKNHKHNLSPKPKPNLRKKPLNIT
jgi:hypothetical protein